MYQRQQYYIKSRKPANTFQKTFRKYELIEIKLNTCLYGLNIN